MLSLSCACPFVSTLRMRAQMFGLLWSRVCGGPCPPTALDLTPATAIFDYSTKPQPTVNPMAMSSSYRSLNVIGDCKDTPAHPNK